ncbi:MAG TPA: S-adenosylmethionine:tRNA ribosyltransferase-isomerase, partial [Candidatus Hodarchaeales archaeon]|nr:S-adenosylmethionine:tRNA ribosyltransferase-isomerase [Candidatus Hodarchaeales archaeon]
MSDVVQLQVAHSSRLHHVDSQLLVVNSDRQTSFASLSDLADWLQRGDVFIVNDAATIPASLRGTVKETGEIIEVRLAYSVDDVVDQLFKWVAIFYTNGDWHLPTEKRGFPSLRDGQTIIFGPSFEVVILAAPVSRDSLGIIQFSQQGSEFWRGLYQYGKLIQYSYLQENLELWDAQTIFSSYPVAVEPPSASFQFNWDLILKIRQKGVKVVTVTHAISISSTGSVTLDKVLPFPERYRISQDTVNQVLQAKSSGNRVIALGTSVTRALESSASSNNGTI